MRLQKNKSQQTVNEEYFQNEFFGSKKSSATCHNFKKIAKSKDKLTMFFCKFNELEEMVLSHDE